MDIGLTPTLGLCRTLSCFWLCPSPASLFILPLGPHLSFRCDAQCYVVCLAKTSSTFRFSDLFLESDFSLQRTYLEACCVRQVKAVETEVGGVVFCPLSSYSLTPWSNTEPPPGNPSLSVHSGKSPALICAFACLAAGHLWDHLQSYSPGSACAFWIFRHLANQMTVCMPSI